MQTLSYESLIPKINRSACVEITDKQYNSTYYSIYVHLYSCTMAAVVSSVFEINI